MADSVRAIAILGVVACHASIGGISHYAWADVAWNGQIGVDIFFMLSAFLLYRPYLVARTTGRSPSARAFLRRRALRILPAYWLALTVLAIWPGLPGVFSSDWWRFYGFLQVYPIGSTSAQGLGVAWTLCIEVSFYLLLPLLAMLMARLAPARQGRLPVGRELAALVVLAAVPVWLRHNVWYAHYPGWITTTLLTQFDYFAVGMALAVVSVAAAQSARRPRWVSVIDRYPGVWFVLSLMTFAYMCHYAPKQYPNIPALHLVMSPITFMREEQTYWLIALISVFLMLPVVFGDARRGLSRRVLGARPVITLGVISYGVYLWHDPLLGWIGGRLTDQLHPPLALPIYFAMALAVSVAVAMLSYRYVEVPFLRRRYRVGRRATSTPQSEAVG